MALSNRLFSDALSDIRELQRRMSVLDQPFFDTFTSPSTFGGGGGASRHMVRFPATDIVEKNDIFEVQAELPGCDKKNIKVEMPDSQTLVLSGSIVEQHTSSPNDDANEEKQQETSNGEENQVVQKKGKDSQVSKSHHHYWMNERISGSFSRTFRFPYPVKTEEIKARYENGVLKMTVPKVSESQPRKITIE